MGEPLAFAMGVSTDMACAGTIRNNNSGRRHPPCPHRPMRKGGGELETPSENPGGCCSPHVSVCVYRIVNLPDKIQILE